MFTPIIVSEFIGKELLCLPQCHSTNDYVIEICKKNAISKGFLCITQHQTAGRGQRGNTWLAAPNQNLTFSFVLKFSENTQEAFFKINMLVSAAILQYLKLIPTAVEGDFAIKWPNDLYYKNQKIGGILIEIINDCDHNTVIIVGIGLNINQVDFGYLNATSLALIFKNNFDLQHQLQLLVLQLESFLNLSYIETQKIIDNVYLKNLYQYNILKKYKINNQVVEASLVTILCDGKVGLKIGKTIKYYQNQEIIFL